MKTRKLTKDDLPSYRRSAKSLGIPVLFQGREDEVVDIHMTDPEYCYLTLNGGRGSPVHYSKLTRILKRKKDHYYIVRLMAMVDYEDRNGKIDKMEMWRTVLISSYSDKHEDIVPEVNAQAKILFDTHIRHYLPQDIRESDMIQYADPEFAESYGVSMWGGMYMEDKEKDITGRDFAIMGRYGEKLKKSEFETLQKFKKYIR